ncbi:integrator complex subunit 6-like [Arvicola amphibius]|uniref:integrator complex subunit 6-like n=1 Tax=Arvicola amphibius TaxID=1047088 RepID=UPI0018E38D83|nr:integrator complex subunit 6-like [Arvicola amphibius]XP_038173410.1 integrator complex subunit 6-like [Arvicola amphibius]
MMAEKGKVLAICSEEEEGRAGEAMDPPLPKMRCLVTLKPVKEKEGKPHLNASVIAKGEGATVSLKAQDGMMKGDSTTTKGSPEWVPSDKSIYLSRARLLREGGDATFTELTVSSEIPAGATSVATLHGDEGVTAGNPISREKFNAEIKRQLMKEIRRYGRKYGRLFELLEEVQGPLEVQIQFVEFAIKEAARFKRRHLIQFLEKKHEEMLFQLSLQQ